MLGRLETAQSVMQGPLPMCHPASPLGRRTHLTPLPPRPEVCGQGLASPRSLHAECGLFQEQSQMGPLPIAPPAGSVLDTGEPPDPEGSPKILEEELVRAATLWTMGAIACPHQAALCLPPPVTDPSPCLGPHPEPCQTWELDLPGPASITHPKGVSKTRRPFRSPNLHHTAGNGGVLPALSSSPPGSPQA